VFDTRREPRRDSIEAVATNVPHVSVNIRVLHVRVAVATTISTFILSDVVYELLVTGEGVALCRLVITQIARVWSFLTVGAFVDDEVTRIGSLVFTLVADKRPLIRVLTAYVLVEGALLRKGVTACTTDKGPEAHVYFTHVLVEVALSRKAFLTTTLVASKRLDAHVYCTHVLVEGALL
jgi:hypothetical protein